VPGAHFTELNETRAGTRTLIRRIENAKVSAIEIIPVG
jgi:hypothetical protein